MTPEFQREVADLLASPLWGKIEVELKQRMPARPDPSEQTFVVAQRALVRGGFENCLDVLHGLPFEKIESPLGEMTQDERERFERIADPRH